MAEKSKVNDILTEIGEFKEHFNGWFNGAGMKRISLRDTMLDNRRRYQMELADRDERSKRNLSCLSSTKSTAAVDRATDHALLDYHSDVDSLSFTAKFSRGELEDQRARWLTEDFHYRCDNTFPFFTWHASSLTAGFCDGLEAAMVSWRKESYTEKKIEKHFHYLNDNGTVEEVPEQVYMTGMQLHPEKFHMSEEPVEKEVVTLDTFWIDQLEPGVNLFWDIKAPYLNLNLGHACLVVVSKSIDELCYLQKMGIFNAISYKELEEYRGLTPEVPDRGTTTTVADADQYDMGDLNSIPVYLYFKKIDNRWKVHFSIKGEKELSKGFVFSDDIFFNGRKVNKLPVVLGTTKLKLWENVGRGLPETLAPIEDEWIDHRNNINDATKIAVQGRYRVEPTSRLKIDDLLNNRVFRATKGEFEKIEDDFSVLTAMRSAETINQDMNELVPVGMESPMVVPRGTTKTLGATQMAAGQQNDKQSVQIMVRNETFFKPLLRLVAELLFAFETDSTILRIAAQKAGMQPPMVGGEVDFRQLDLDVDVSVNAGLGSVPRQQKAQFGIQLFDWGAAHGVSQDSTKMYRELSVLSGFKPDQFLGKPVPAQPDNKTSLSVTAAWSELPPELQNIIARNLMAGTGGVDAKLKASFNEQQHNQPKAGPSDMTQGRAAEAMSEGGQRGR